MGITHAYPFFALFPPSPFGKGGILIKKLVDTGAKAPVSTNFLTFFPSPVYGGACRGCFFPGG